MVYDIGVFISHSWSYSEHYDKLAEWIFREPWNYNGVPLAFRDCSVPKYDPIHYAQNTEHLRQAIYSKIVASHVVVIPTGMYANHSNWIQKEIDGAHIHRKPILAVNPHGQERNSSVVVGNSSHEVGWTKQSVIEGIWRLYRSA